MSGGKGFEQRDDIVDIEAKVLANGKHGHHKCVVLPLPPRFDLGIRVCRGSFVLVCVIVHVHIAMYKRNG